MGHRLPLDVGSDWFRSDMSCEVSCPQTMIISDKWSEAIRRFHSIKMPKMFSGDGKMSIINNQNVWHKMVRCRWDSGQQPGNWFFLLMYTLYSKRIFWMLNLNDVNVMHLYICICQASLIQHIHIIHTIKHYRSMVNTNLILVERWGFGWKILVKKCHGAGIKINFDSYYRRQYTTVSPARNRTFSWIFFESDITHFVFSILIVPEYFWTNESHTDHFVINDYGI